MVCTEHRTDPTGEQRDEGECLGRPDSSLFSWEFKRGEEEEGGEDMSSEGTNETTRSRGKCERYILLSCC